MGKYGQVAVLAIEGLQVGGVKTPVDAWESAVREAFPMSLSAQQKACPKGTFLGLCELGMVSGVAPGNYTRSRLNKLYGLKAVELLRENPKLADDQDGLWRLIGNSSKVQNHQMDVVTSLWKKCMVA